MSKLSSVLKKTGIAVAAAAMLVTMGAGTVVTQAKTSLPVYKVSLAKKYTNNQKGKQMEASVKIPKVKITGTDGKVMKSESEKLNAAISSYQNKFIKDYKKDVAAIKKGEKGNESLTSGYKVVTDNDKLFEWSVEEIPQDGWSLREVTRDLHANGPVGVMTDYEKKFHELGKNINRCVAVMQPWEPAEENGQDEAEEL